ncbi:hypothetical protein E2562_003914 [Oryza meyeriana var. granulata]|uniref:Uncharacterized protein n=1 Tax=Oryza meyeriana var. granulata TaxID=110450 RepID=A0A6G1CZ02_9ORYZ|nr:hypothetical protein E2562_003914 [Oryza meyeriana var. granulata]
MEDLVSGSSVRSVLSCSSSEEQSQAQPEESTWTDYFVDFMMSEEKKRQDDDSYCTHGGGGVYGDCSDQKVEEEEGEEDSMISDAASCAPAAALPDRYKELKKLKKKVFKALDHDDSLKDTASSPVNSPKVSALSQLELSPKRRCNTRDLTKEVGIGDDHGREGMDYADAMVEGMRFVDQSQKSITPCAELKNKGLCLFPLSMLLHYHG